MIERQCEICNKIDILKTKQNISKLCKSCNAKKRLQKHKNPMQDKKHKDLTLFRPTYDNVNYNDFILKNKNGKNKRFYKMSCAECGTNRGYLAHCEAKRSCLACHTQKVTKKTKEQKHTYSCFKSNINARFKHRNIAKQPGIFRHLPYTIHELMKHLESLFEPWMTWDNHGAYSSEKDTWHIDHIIADSHFQYTSPQDEDFLKSWALSNLRPLKAIDNIKKSNK